MSGVKVVEAKADDVHFSLGSGSAGPRYYFGERSGYSEEVDPFPAYPHDAQRVFFGTRWLQEQWPLDVDVVYHVSHFEGTGRTNGWSTTETIWGADEEPNRTVGHIFLSGKRIPPHPAVTDYVVAHEYGHQVQWHIERRRGLQTNDLLKEYAEIRNMQGRPLNGRYGGQWHEAVGEVFACDFRVLVASVESAYWPHEGIERPSPIGPEALWWDEQHAVLGAAA